MNKNILLIDLQNSGQIRLAIFSQEMTKESVQEGNNRELLTAIAEFLEKNSLSPRDLFGIAVVEKTGSFSSTRISATIANAWKATLGTKVVAVEPGVVYTHDSLLQALESAVGYISAHYSAEPNIGTPKKDK